MTTIDVIQYPLTVPLGCSRARAFRGDGDWPVGTTGLTGLTISGQIRKSPTSPTALIDLTDTVGLVLDTQTITLTISAANTLELGPGVFHYGVRAHDAGSGAVYALIYGTLTITPFADRTAP